MPMFESFAKFLANLSPRTERVQDHRSAVQPGQPSTPPRSRSDRNPFTLGSDDSQPEAISVRSAGTTTHPEAVHSYVDTIFSPPGPPITSERSHTRISHPVLDPRDRLEMFPRQSAGAQKLTTTSARRTGQSSQMLNNDPHKDSRDRQDEARLLGGSYKDPQAVKIKTGATMQPKKKPGSGYAFSPSDKISDKSRTSGPVRARGKSKQQASGMGRNPISLDDGFEESSRPSKRRRQSDVGHEIDRTPTANSHMDRSQQTVLSSPLQNSRLKHRGSAGLPQNLNEFNDVERTMRMSPGSRRSQIRQFSFDSPDEKFTEKAAQQRRDLMSAASTRLSQVNGKPKGAGDALVMDRIEIGTKKAAKNRGTISSNPTHPPVNARESPDELQGDITTHPMPKTLTEAPVKAGRQSRIEIHPPPTRKRSPSDIQPTEFSSPQDKKKAKRSHHKSAKKSMFRASYLRMGSFSKTCTKDESAPIYVVDNGLQIPEDILGPGPDFTLRVSFDEIRNILVGDGMSRKVRLSMAGARSDNNKIFDIELWTPEEKDALLSIPGLPNIGQELRDAKHMDKAFAEHGLEFKDVPNEAIRSSHDESSDRPAKARRKPKLSDGLRLANGEPYAKVSKKERRGKSMMAADGFVESRDTSPVRARRQRSSPPAKPLKSILKHRGDQPPESDTDTGTEIPVEPLGATARETRASSRREPGRHLGMNGGDTHDMDKKCLLEDDGFRENWKKPLVYPPNGKKKAEVNLDDRDRLREDIFLNDNLIAFYMRFLQDHLERTNKDAANRVYFFNSYFFATLTNAPRAKRGELNYKGVEKWTRSVDLFSYDYILVPINEHHHWYIAIICNLPNLSFEDAEPVELVEPSQTSSPAKEPTNIPETKVQEIQETPEPESGNASEGSPKKDAEQSPELPKESDTRRHLASLSIEETELADKDAKNPQEKEQPASGEGQDADEILSSSPANLSKISAQKLAQDEAAASQSTGKSKKKRTGPKLNPNQTTIITFDSLDLSRYPTIRVLREYLSQEASSKRGVKIDTSAIKGMRGQGIPIQLNFSDCGLYLLVYVEKFVQSPDWFITKMLQRSMDPKDDWPPLGSGLLRYRLRKFLDELYKEQSQTSRQSNKPIMANRTPIDFLLGPPLPRQDTADIDVVPESQHETQQKTDAPSTVPVKKSTPVDSAPRKTAEDQSDDSAVDQMYMVPTESPRTPKHKASKTATEKPRKSRSSPAKGEPIIQVPCSQEEPEVPRTPSPANVPRKRRSPRGPPK